MNINPAAAAEIQQNKTRERAECIATAKEGTAHLLEKIKAEEAGANSPEKLAKIKTKIDRDFNDYYDACEMKLSATERENQAKIDIENAKTRTANANSSIEQANVVIATAQEEMKITAAEKEKIRLEKLEVIKDNELAEVAEKLMTEIGE